ncbi:MAG TPA: hypothetical protein VMH05_14890 [Bryobacteraceae bacterium]|nr:hypothetical protein [Bryobacteraceae bacterium]
MPTFIQILEEMADARSIVSIPAAEVDRLVHRFGDRVRLMGRWNASTDGSLDVPIAAIREAAAELGNRALLDALTEIKSESFTKLIESSAAVQLIEKTREAYERHLRRLMNSYQDSRNPAEVTRLRDQIVREIFGE